jgi:(2Fe-2S) ferredoxin/ferredoxin
MKVVVDELLCDGYGKCERIAPDLFSINEEGVALVLIVDDLCPEQLVRARAAANLCPVNAIKLETRATHPEEEFPKSIKTTGHAEQKANHLTSPFERHLFVCTSGEYCPVHDGNSKEIHKALKEQARSAALKGKVRINNSGCLDQCGHGPMAVVYPEGVWYSHLTLEDVPLIVEEHLVNNRPVEHLRYYPPKIGGNKLERNPNDQRVAGQTDGCREAWPIIPNEDPNQGNPEQNS